MLTSRHALQLLVIAVLLSSAFAARAEKAAGPPARPRIQSALFHR